MKVQAWTNGGATYGIRVGAENRVRYFQPGWTRVIIAIEGGEVIEAALTDGFWRKCPEIRHREFRAWFSVHRLIPWPSGSPPHLELTPEGERRFRLHRP